MSTNNEFVGQSYQILGAAIDSLIQTVIIAGIVAITILVIAVGLESRMKSETRGFFSRKPILIPGIVFIICALLVISLGPAPMSQYYGAHQKQFFLNDDDDTGTFTVYGGIVYSQSVSFQASSSLEDLVTLVIDLEFYSEGELIKDASVAINGSTFLAQETGQVSVPLEPGFYDINFYLSVYYNGSRTFRAVSASCYLSQPLAAGMLDEVMEWDTYRLGLFIGFIGIFLAGIYVDRGSIIEKKPEYYQE